MGVLGGWASYYEQGTPADVTVIQSTKTPGGCVTWTFAMRACLSNVCKVVLTLCREDRVLDGPASGEKVCKGRKAPMAPASSLCRALSA